MPDIESTPSRRAARPGSPLPKKATGIPGFDEISLGGLPEGRVVGVLGGAGAGKTVMALQILVNRAHDYGDPGIFITFEESPQRLRVNAAGFSWDFGTLDGSKIYLVDGRLPPSALLGGAFDLAGLLAHIDALVRETGATSVVFDGLDVLLGALTDFTLERAELQRIDHWVHDREITCIITGKASGEAPRDRSRLDQLHYMTDVVIELEGRMLGDSFARTLRIGKFRGSDFAANAFPVAITEEGLEVVAKVRARLGYPTFTDRLSTGIQDLDDLLEGGLLRGTATLVSGAPGTGKTTQVGHFIAAACAHGERTVYVSFDESDTQILRDLKTIGIDLEPSIAEGRLTIVPLRAASRSPDGHFVALRALIDRHAPSCLVLDPISSLIRSNYPFSAEICESLLDEARIRGITLLCTSLAGISVNDQELSSSNLSTIADTWIHLTFNQVGGERNRALTIVKSRGTAHSNQVREALIGPEGMKLVDVYSAEGEVLMGSARAQREYAERLHVLDLEMDYALRELESRQALATMERKFQTAKSELEWKQKEVELLAQEAKAREENARFAARERIRLRPGGGPNKEPQK
jgi:circadian clock protein KaiC